MIFLFDAALKKKPKKNSVGTEYFTEFASYSFIDVLRHSAEEEICMFL